MGPGTNPEWLIGDCAPPLVGRERDLRAAAEAIAAARDGHGRVLAVEGPSGIGKTRMLAAITAEASDFIVMRATGSISERGFALGVARDLVEQLPAGGESRPAGQAGTAGGLGMAIRQLIQLTLARAARARLLIAVDDLHWADEPSLRYLAQLATRLANAAVLIVLAWRGDESGAQTVDALLGSIGERLALEPLDEDAIAELLELLGPGCGRLARSVHVASAGRTMLAVELCRSLAGDGRRPPDGSIGSIDALAPPAIARAVAHQLAGHGPAATALAQAIALLGADARLRVAAALAGLALEDAARVGDRLRSACLLAPAAPLAFVAPVVRNVVYESIPLGQRALLHAAAARLLVVSGASEEAITEHLMRSEPADDPAAVELLRRAASEATARGDPRRAALLLERALAEPPPPAERSAVVLELGVAESRVVMPGAPGHLAQALRAGTPAERAEAALELAEQHLLSARYGEAAALLESELEELPLRGADVVLRLRAELTACRLVSAGPRSPSRWGDGTDELSGATQGERALLAVAACGGALAGEPRELTLPLAQRALEGRGAGVSGGISSIAVAMLLVQAAQSAEAPALGQRALEQALAAAGASGSAIGEIALLAIRSRCRLATDALGEAEADARRALEHSRRLGLELLASLALASLLEALLDQGRIADAERELAAGGADALAADDLAHCLLLIARGRLRAAAGEAHLGLRDLLAAGARLLRSDCGTPSFDWRSRAGLLSHRLDRREQALRLIDDELALAQRLGAPRPLGVALRARALIAPPPDQIELLGAAVQLLRATPAKLDCARALCDLGAATRRSGSRNQAREPLQEALQLAHECGAVALAGRARHELIVLGARPRRHAVTGVEALTARERQASELAAEGLTNRQIAATMTVTPNTVEYHLTNAYRKLGIATRDELRAGLGGVRPGADQLARARA